MPTLNLDAVEIVTESTGQRELDGCNLARARNLATSKTNFNLHRLIGRVLLSRCNRGGDMPKCLVTLKVPFWFDYEYQPHERATYEYPGCSEHVVVNDVEIPDDLKELLLSGEYADDVEEQCLEDYKDNQRGRF